MERGKNMSEKTTITLQLPNGSSESITLDACLFGGIIGDGSGFPCGGYHGNLDPTTSLISMIHIMRAFIKTGEENGMNLEQAKLSLDFCIQEAIKKEDQNDPLDNVDLETHMIKIRKDKTN
jgi:hypothetical protein